MLAVDEGIDTEPFTEKLAGTGVLVFVAMPEEMSTDPFREKLAETGLFVLVEVDVGTVWPPTS